MTRFLLGTRLVYFPPAPSRAEVGRAYGLFAGGFFTDPATGERERRAHPEEIAAAFRLWSRHRAIREGRWAG
jgi:hypothetical protein